MHILSSHTHTHTHTHTNTSMASVTLFSRILASFPGLHAQLLISSVKHHWSLTCGTALGACTIGYTSSCEGGWWWDRWWDMHILSSHTHTHTHARTNTSVASVTLFSRILASFPGLHSQLLVLAVRKARGGGLDRFIMWCMPLLTVKFSLLTPGFILFPLVFFPWIQLFWSYGGHKQVNRMLVSEHISESGYVLILAWSFWYLAVKSDSVNT